MKKILSIIVPAYNMEEYLPKCLGSLVIEEGELLQKLDIIVVNDGSQDHTSAVAHGFEADYPGVFRVIDKINGHYGSCVNTALPLAAGIYVKVLDADDYVSKQAFAKFCRLVEQECQKGDNGADLLVSNYQRVAVDGTLIEVFDYDLAEEHGYYTLDEYTNVNERFTIHSVVYRTEMVRKMNYHQTEGINYTDTEWIIEPMTRVRRFLFQKAPVTCYLVGRQGQSTNSLLFARNFQQVADVTAGLVERFDSRSKSCIASARGYYHDQIAAMLRMVYNGWLHGWSGEKCTVDISKFEERIAENDHFYKLSEKIFARLWKWRYYFVADWRKHHRVYTIKRMLYNAAWPILHFIYHSIYVKLRHALRAKDS